MRTLVRIASLLMLVGLALAQATPDAPRKIRIHKLTIESRTLPSADREQIIRQFEGKTYSADTPATFEEEVGERIRDSLQILAYFKALVTDLRISFLKGQAEAVDVTAAVDEGVRYRLGEITFKNGTVFPPEELREAFAMQTGEILDTEKMRKGIKSLRDLYGAKGYINFTPVPDTTIHDSRATVDVTFDLDEGKPFRFGPLVLDGLEPHPGAGKALLESWKALQGQTYNPNRLHQWLVGNRSNLPLDVERLVEISQDDTSGTVIVRLWFP